MAEQSVPDPSAIKELRSTMGLFHLCAMAIVLPG
jgi:hypothetical protein